jgi:sulfonate transport system permease protein
MRRVIPWILPCILVICWQLSGTLGWMSNRVLPTPTQVILAGYRLTLSGELQAHLLISFKRAAVGFLLGGSLGLVLGVITGASKTIESILDSTVQMLRAIPHLALIPLVIVWFGVGESAKVFLVALGVLFPIYVNSHHGIVSADPSLVEMGRIYGLSQFGVFRSILLPSALPSILVGIRYALGVMWLTLIVAETIAATSGIGYMAMNAREFMRLDIVMLSILLYAVLGKLADMIAKFLEHRLLTWNPRYSDESSLVNEGLLLEHNDGAKFE